MLGFVLGAVFVWCLPRPERSAPPVSDSPQPPVLLERPQLTEIEAVFAEWGQFAIWEHDTTQVALWDSARKSYSIFYEVLRSGDTFYFRTIPQFTRPILTHGVKAEWPLQFTEPEAARSEWLRQTQFEFLTGPQKRQP
jgi:hypothetical protein